MFKNLLCSFLLLLNSLPLSAAGPPPLPNGNRVLHDFKETIVPYFMQKSALGEPYGNFPTFRCNNGLPFNEKAPCAELVSREWLVAKLGRQYTRMISRQAFTYGVIFHLTGNPEALKHAQAGVDYIRKALLQDNGSVVSYIDANGKPGLLPRQRTSQDLAYAQLGLAMLYYLTRDAALLQDIVRIKDYVFSQYRDLDKDMLKWVLQDGDEQFANQQELVAQLDQINAYMLLLYPLMPDTLQESWKQDLSWLADVLRYQFHSDDEQRFYGYIHHKSGQSHKSRHGDFGHTSKAYWMLYLVGQNTGNRELSEWAASGLLSVLERAFGEYQLLEVLGPDQKLPEGSKMTDKVGFWNSHIDTRGSAWWEYAELDQAAWTLSLKYPALDEKIGHTYRTWQNAMIDYQYGSTWLYLNGVGTPKTFHWKNGYHESERALVLYILAQARSGQTATLYFALPETGSPIVQPYYFRAKQVKVKSTNSGIQEVEFRDIY